jgi:hypothetical protein
MACHAEAMRRREERRETQKTAGEKFFEIFVFYALKS